MQTGWTQWFLQVDLALTNEPQVAAQGRDPFEPGNLWWIYHWCRWCRWWFSMPGLGDVFPIRVKMESKFCTPALSRTSPRLATRRGWQVPDLHWSSTCSACLTPLPRGNSDQWAENFNSSRFCIFSIFCPWPRQVIFLECSQPDAKEHEDARGGPLHPERLDTLWPTTRVLGSLEIRELLEICNFPFECVREPTNATWSSIGPLSACTKLACQPGAGEQMGCRWCKNPCRWLLMPTEAESSSWRILIPLQRGRTWAAHVQRMAFTESLCFFVRGFFLTGHPLAASGHIPAAWVEWVEQATHTILVDRQSWGQLPWPNALPWQHCSASRWILRLWAPASYADAIWLMDLIFGWDAKIYCLAL